MNNDRRKRIAALRDKLGDIQAEIEALRDEEQDSYDNLPESFQNGDKGEKAQAAIDALIEAEGNIDEAISNLETAEE